MAARRRELKPVTFVPARIAFKPEVLVQVHDKDINGWVDKRERVKFELPAYRKLALDRDTARIFAAKGYVTILKGDSGPPVSEDELAELTAKDQVVGLGGHNG